MPLDEVLLEVEGLDLVLGDDHFDVLDPLRELTDRGTGVQALLEIRAHAGAERFRLADIENLAALVTEEVHSRLRGQRFQLGLQTGRHASSLALPEKYERPGWRGRAAGRVRSGAALASFPAPCGESRGNTILTTVNLSAENVASPPLKRGFCLLTVLPPLPTLAVPA